MNRIYLAGPINRVDDDGATWRRGIKTVIDRVAFEDPLDNVQMPAADTEVVEADLAALGRSDAVLVGYRDVLSVGTPMEVKTAADAGMPIAIWIRDGTFYSDLSPWYRHFAGFIGNSADDAIDWLEEQLDGGDRE